MGVDPDLRAKFRRKIAADYEAHTLRAGNRMPHIERLPTGSLALDYITAGGYPFGRMTRSWGGFSSGKSLSIWNAFRQAQRYGEAREAHLLRLADLAAAEGRLREVRALRDEAKAARQRYPDGLRCLYVAAERIYDPVYVEKLLGVKTDEDHLEIVETTRIEEIGDIVQEALAAYHVVAVDSTTDTISIDELGRKDGLFEKPIPLHRIQKWGINFDWWRDRISPENVLIYVSQIKSRIGMNVAQRVSGEYAPGGHKMEHESSLTLHYMRGGQLKRRGDGGLEPVGEEGGAKGAFGKTQRVGDEIIVRCDKNKQGPSGRVALLHFDKQSANFDALHEYEKLAKFFRVVRTSGSWSQLPSGKNVQRLREYLAADDELRAKVEAVIYRCATDPYYERELLASKGGPGEAMVAALAD